MNTGCLSIFSYILQFLSSAIYSFQCRDLSSSWLDLFLGVLSIFWGYRNRIIFLISFWACLLLVYRKSIVFLMLILNLRTWVKVFTSKSFFMVSKYRIILSVSRKNLAPSLLIICLLCLSLASLVWIRFAAFYWINGECGQWCFITTFRRKAFNFSSFTIILAISLLHISNNLSSRGMVFCS
jgi:hypothetical protein